MILFLPLPPPDDDIFNLADRIREASTKRRRAPRCPKGHEKGARLDAVRSDGSRDYFCCLCALKWTEPPVDS